MTATCASRCDRIECASAQAVLSKDPDGTNTVLEEIRAFRRPALS
jgi:hypothetical protein